MKALVLSQYRELELQDLPQPTPSADEVLIQVRACGICGSDVHGYDGSTGRRIPPLVMGHEAAGVIAAVGGEVRDLPLVTGSHSIPLSPAGNAISVNAVRSICAMRVRCWASPAATIVVREPSQNL